MEHFKGKNILNFVKELPNDDKCKEYLAKYKWQDGFTCSKCQGNKGCMKKDYKYHCYNCNCHHVESSTANTLFHKVKFGLQKAFCIVFEMSTSSKSVSSIQFTKTRFNSTIKFAGRLSKGLTAVSFGAIIYDGATNGWENSHNADLFVTGILLDWHTLIQ